MVLCKLHFFLSARTWNVLLSKSVDVSSTTNCVEICVCAMLTFVCTWMFYVHLYVRRYTQVFE